MTSYPLPAGTFEDAIEIANNFVADTNAADYVGPAAISHIITKTPEGVFIARFEFAPFGDDEKVAAFDAFIANPANLVELAA